jgi:hypothetical protein
MEVSDDDLRELYRMAGELKMRELFEEPSSYEDEEEDM